jgi:hypothetical protein
VKRALLLLVFAVAPAVEANGLDPNGLPVGGYGWVTLESTFETGKLPGGDGYGRVQEAIGYQGTILFDAGHDQGQVRTSTGHPLGLEVGLRLGFRAPEFALGGGAGTPPTQLLSKTLLSLDAGVPLRLLGSDQNALVFYLGPRLRMGGDWTQGVFQISLQLALRYAVRSEDRSEYSLEARLSPMQWSTSADVAFSLDGPTVKPLATSSFDRIDYGVTPQRISGSFLAGLRLGLSPMRDVHYSGREYGATLILGWVL